MQECGTEVGNLDFRALRDEDVGRLDVAVNDARAVRRVERAAAFEADFYRVLDRQQLLRMGERHEVAAGHVFEGDITRFFTDYRIEQSHNMRMGQLAHQRCFVQELGARRLTELRIEKQAGIDDFERNVMGRKCIGGKVYRARSALAELFF